MLQFSPGFSVEKGACSCGLPTTVPAVLLRRESRDVKKEFFFFFRRREVCFEVSPAALARATARLPTAVTLRGRFGSRTVQLLYFVGGGLKKRGTQGNIIPVYLESAQISVGCRDGAHRCPYLCRKSFASFAKPPGDCHNIIAMHGGCCTLFRSGCESAVPVERKLRRLAAGRETMMDT